MTSAAEHPVDKIAFTVMFPVKPHARPSDVSAGHTVFLSEACTDRALECFPRCFKDDERRVKSDIRATRFN